MAEVYDVVSNHPPSNSIGSEDDNPFSKSGLIPRLPPHSVSPIKITFKKKAKNSKETVEVNVIAKTPQGRSEEPVEAKAQNNNSEENKEKIPQEELLSISLTRKEQDPVMSNTTMAESKTETRAPAVPDFVAPPQFNLKVIRPVGT
ncbi:hypothetical protein JTB14_003977 [Gonioctena quinquepunctata]|nr:hypothetical protein JTB14_003977 [Gonioctena quinquepunctata]